MKFARFLQDISTATVVCLASCSLISYELTTKRNSNDKPQRHETILLIKSFRFELSGCASQTAAETQQNKSRVVAKEETESRSVGLLSLGLHNRSRMNGELD